MNKPDFEALLRPHLRSLKPYASARDEFTGEAEVFLDANENPLGSALNAAHNRYPDPLQRAVKASLANIKGIGPEYQFLGNGSDEAIDLLMRAFCEPGQDEILIMPPTYGMYRVSADINGVAAREVPLKPGFELDVEGVLNALSPKVKLIFICSPNNPSGNLLDAEGIQRIIAAAPGLVVLDEAYIDFAPEASFVPALPQFPKLVILQTFSKAWGLANLRLGMGFAHPEVIQILNKIKPPYNVNGMTQQLALEALKNVDQKDAMVQEILDQRAWLRQQLEELPEVKRVHPSDANFLLTEVTNPDGMYRSLIEEGIIVRNRSRVYLCEGCLRITVGTAQENRELLAAWKRIGAST